MIYYTIVIKGKENPENQKGYSMEECYFGEEVISMTAWQNIRSAFYRKYDQRALRDFASWQVPPCIRWHNRNVYALVDKFNGEYAVSNFYRFARDGHPIKLFIKLTGF